MIDNRTVGKIIAALRQAKGMTQQQLAAAMNVSHQAVSKWENGAALPDIQTLIELTQLFGITVEQLLSGEIPEARLDAAPTPDNSNPIQSFGSFVSGVIDDIGNIFKSTPKNVSSTHQVQDNTAEDKGTENDEENASTASAASDSSEDTAQNIDLQNLLQMAPFMSKSAVEEMLKNCKQKLSATDIARFAPFVDGAFLEQLIRENEVEINWDTLRRIAPFLKKEAVDALTRMVAMGEKYVRPVAEEVNRTAEDVYKTIDDVSRRIGKGVDMAVKKVVRLGENVAAEVSRAFDNLTAEPMTREQRMAALRRSAFERAMEDGKWEWIEAHISELQDEELKSRISERANKLGMQDWVCKHLGNYADPQIVREAIDNGDWGWLGEHVQKFDASLQCSVALAAMKAENWQWLSSYAEQLDIEGCVVEIATTARRAGARMLAVQLVRYDMLPDQLEAVALEALGAGDFEFFELIYETMPSETLCKCCIRMAKAGNWEDVHRFVDKLEAKHVEWLMQIAIDAGNFDAIDMLDTFLQKQ